MPIDEEAFFQTLRPPLIHKELGKSLLPFREGERPARSEINDFLRSLLADIQTRRYVPMIPRGYIVLDKGNYVPRISPVLTYRDMCVYYFCLNQLQEELAINRVPGTFGGWKFGNPMREKEGEELASHDVPYSFANALNPFRWMKYWKEFQRIAYEKSRQPAMQVFIEYDIANFYDSVNLDVLERKVRERCSSLQADIVDLLFTLLRQWNRRYQGYNDKRVGLPQEESADCSRILANFYLQDYDASMSFLSNHCYTNAEYLRYSDVHLIMTEYIDDARKILVDAARNLHRLGLNIGAAKVREFHSRVDFDYYWSFELMDMLGDEEDITKINDAAFQFNNQMVSDLNNPLPRPWRWRSVERRILSVGLAKVEEPIRTEIARRLLQDRSVERMDAFMFSAVARGLTEDERKLFFSTIDNLIPRVPFNSFHLNLLRFFAKYEKPWRGIAEIEDMIRYLNFRWDPATTATEIERDEESLRIF